MGLRDGARDYSKFKKCVKCELMAYCRGCPAVASGTRGDFYDADPQCWKEVQTHESSTTALCYTGRAGVLGGVYALEGFDPIKEIPNGVYLTGFFSNYPNQKVLDDIFNFIKLHQLEPCIGETFAFSDIQKACIAMDSGKVNGKIVVRM